MSHPGSQGCDIDHSSANVLEILHAYGTFRQTPNANYSNENIVRKVRQLEKEFSCNLLKAALVWASRHGCLLSQTYNAYEVPDGGRSEKMFRAQVHEDLRAVHHLRRGLNGAWQPASFI